jgi:general nucleoside transport system permease protein
MSVRAALGRQRVRAWALTATVAVICLAASLVTLWLLAVLVGASTMTVLHALVEGSLTSRHALAATLRETAPIALCGLAFLLPFRAGFFNIGGQGQLEAGALAAVAVATLPGGPATATWALVLAAGAGAVVAAPALVLKTQRAASEVTTTIMINFAVIELALAMVTGPMKDPTAFFGTTHAIPDAARLPVTPASLGVHLGVWLAVAAAGIVHWAQRRTLFGFRLAALGGKRAEGSENRAAARAAGIPVDRVLAATVLVSAALAGLAGGIQVLGVVYRVAEGWSRPWGFVGILAALLGGSPLGAVGASFLLAALETGGRHMQAMTGVPSAMVYVLQALPVILYLGLRATPIARRLAEGTIPLHVVGGALVVGRPSVGTS